MNIKIKIYFQVYQNQLGFHLESVFNLIDFEDK